jgi:DNA (cytosine-5)-methyltransferase 1
MTLTYGSLFSGTGMLDEGVQSVLGGELSWYAEFDAAASKVMAHHYPGIPNLGDVTKVDWASVPHIDILTGGSPCQDLSHAGKRAGMTAGTRSNLWVQMREAIAVLRPRLVVWENVRGALSASADSDLEPCPGCVGDPDDGPALRALGRVLGDLADIGYDARWYGLRAADVGAPHGRFRIFLFAVPADAARDSWRFSNGDGSAAADTEHGGWDGRALDSLGSALGGTATTGGGEGASRGLTLLPTPVADNSRGLPSSGTDFQSLPNAVCALLRADRWGQYAPAIARWESILGRPAPAPTEPTGKGTQRLSSRFVEWLMGCLAGWVTDLGLTRNEELKILGNSVVRQQAAAATRAWVCDMRAERAA